MFYTAFKKINIIAGLALLVAGCSLFAQQPTPSPAAGGDDQTAKIVLHRPMAKGHKYGMKLDVKIHSEGSMGMGMESIGGGSQDAAIIFNGSVLVMDVNAIGEPTMMLVHVDKAEYTEEKKTEKLKCEGADMGIQLKGKTSFSCRDGRAIPAEEQQLLAMIFDAPSGISGDEYLGPGKDVRQGESWKVKKEAWAKSLDAQNPGVDAKSKTDPSKLDGTITFVGIEDVQGAKCHHLKTDMTIQSSNIPNFTGESFTQIKEDIYLPADPASTKSRTEGEQNQRTKGKVVSKDGAMVDIKNQTKITYKSVIE